jgi:penicillin-binding protein 1B
LIRRIIFALAAAALLIHFIFALIEAGKGIGGAKAAPTIFYGQPLEIRKGDHPGNLRLTERLNRLSYRQVREKPAKSGTFSLTKERLWLFLRGAHEKGFLQSSGPVEIALANGRVASLASPDGKPLDSVRLEPEEIGRLAGPKMESRTTVSLSGVSPYLQNAVIACEDKRFYHHIGIDPLAAGRALSVNLREKRFAQGASTITQQLARNVFLSPKKTFARKLREMELALALELRYSKQQILEMYLNRIYLGQAGDRGIYGVEEASRFYFSRHAADLSLEEAALLASIIHAPNRYSLAGNPRTALERRDRVLSSMRQLDMITQPEFERALAAPARIHAGAPPAHLPSYFIDYILRITKEDLGAERPYHPGYRYYTTLDSFQQAAAEEAVARGMEIIEKKARGAAEPLQAALVAIDPKTGHITAMVGGRSYAQTRFNRAVDALRQPGSAFKPFVLLAALSRSLEKKGEWTLSTPVSGEPISLSTPEGMWTPTNFENKQYARITIRKAIEDSVNTATVRLAADVGFKEVLKTARAAGIASPLLPVPSMALGSFEVSPLELAYAYATLASGGTRFERFALFSVTTPDGDRLWSGEIKRQQVFDPRATYLTGYALEGVLERGTAREARALKIDFPVSGKTGTTNGNRDSWFVGYTPDVVCAVWVGYDSGADTGLTGATGALRIHARFMRSFYSQSGPPAVAAPDGIEWAVIDPDSGSLATSFCPRTFQEAYLRGTAPGKTCSDHPVHPVMDALRHKMREAEAFLRGLLPK